MADRITEIFGKGIFNKIVKSELIPDGAASDSLNWKTQDDSVELSRGKLLIGDEASGNGKVHKTWFGFKADGTAVQFKRFGTKVQYLNGSTWTDSITGLTDDADCTFQNYVSPSGHFTFVSGVDGLYKIVTANPADAVGLTDTSKSPTGENDYGNILISDARIFAWGVQSSPTTLYLSHIDQQSYTTVSSEAIGSSGSTNYTGTLAFKAGGSTRTCFGISFTDGTQTLTDDRNGGFTGNGSGTINYATGAYNITFDATTTGSVTADYQWENSNADGLGDFTFTTPTRVAGEGDFFLQDKGGDSIQNVIPQDGRYYSIKERNAYELFLTNDDTNATNEVFRTDIGSPSNGASVGTSLGIVLLNTSNETEPELTRLERNITGDDLVTVNLAPQFDFSPYKFDECEMDTHGESIIIACKSSSSAPANDRIIAFNNRLKSIDVYGYDAQSFAKNAGLLYVGDSITDNVYQLFSGFDDDEFTIENYWDSKAERYKTENLKRFRRMEVKGLISPDQTIEVHVSYDNDDFALVGTISGSGSYVDRTQAYTIGANETGSAEVGGGGSGTEAFFYDYEFKVNSPKFRKRVVRFKATGIGFASVSFQKDIRIISSSHGHRRPKKYR